MTHSAVQLIRLEALRLAAKEVKREIHARGFRYHSFSRADIQLAAREWFQGHRRELIETASASILRWRLEEALRRANLRSAAQKPKAQKSMASAVQISGVK
jgi:hypothetical protein